MQLSFGLAGSTKVYNNVSQHTDWVRNVNQYFLCYRHRCRQRDRHRNLRDDHFKCSLVTRLMFVKSLVQFSCLHGAGLVGETPFGFGEHHHREVASTTRCHLVPDWDSVDSDICYAVLPTGDVKKVTTYLVMLLSTKLMLLTVGQWPTCSLWIIIELRKLEIWAVVPKTVGVWSLKQREVCLSAVPSKKYGLFKSFLEL